jgi:poly-beta-1,6-N-acetyl-D-glucosamine synthase
VATTIQLLRRVGIISSHSMIYFILVLIFVRLLYWIFIFIRLALYKPNGIVNVNEVGVSVVICVKDNLEQLQINLNKILKQNYPLYEIVIVDDYSSDGLKKYLDELDHPLIKYIHASQDLPGKKLALSEGVKAAKYEWILQTDSDCKVASLDWIKHMMGSKKETTKVVLGISPLKSQGGLIGYLSAYESVYIAMQYLSYSLWGKPYMGVGRNQLFEKKSFTDANPYASNMDLASGDDDFLVQSISNAQNTTICIEPNGFTYSASPMKLDQFIHQKKRHITTAPRYKGFHQYSLGLFGFLHIAIYLAILIGLIGKWILVKEALGAFLFMIGLITIIQIPIFAKLRQGYLISWIAIADLFFAGFYVYLSIGLLTKRNQIAWKR